MTVPWGALCYALAALCAALVARRRPEHGPIRDTLVVAALQALLVSELVARFLPISPRPALALWLLVPASAGRAYLRAFDAPTALKALGVVSVLLVLVALFAPQPARWWSTAIWAPLGVAAGLGVIAGAAGSPRADTFTKRTAWALIASDVFALVCHWKWPDVQPLQGKAAALAVAALHLPELRRGTRSDS